MPIFMIVVLLKNRRFLDTLYFLTASSRITFGSQLLIFYNFILCHFRNTQFRNVSVFIKNGFLKNAVKTTCYNNSSLFADLVSDECLHIAMSVGVILCNYYVATPHITHNTKLRLGVENVQCLI